MNGKVAPSAPYLSKDSYIDNSRLDSQDLVDLISQLYHSPVYLSRLTHPTRCSFTNWVTSVLVVDFDINVGHVAEVEYPIGALTEEEQARLLRMSLPDSNSLTSQPSAGRYASSRRASTMSKRGWFDPKTWREAKKFWKVGSWMMNNNQTPSSTYSTGSPIQPTTNHNTVLQSRTPDLGRNWFAIRFRRGSCLPISHSSLSDHNFLMGAALFRSSPNIDSRRGAKQESFVILSPLSSAFFFSITLPLTLFLGTAYFDHGPSVIFDACASIASWPMPSETRPGTRLCVRTTAGPTLELFAPSVPELGVTFASSRAGPCWDTAVSLDRSPNNRVVSDTPSRSSGRNRFNSRLTNKQPRLWTPRAITALRLLISANTQPSSSLAQTSSPKSSFSLDPVRSPSLLSSLSSLFGSEGDESLHRSKSWHDEISDGSEEEATSLGRQLGLGHRCVVPFSSDQHQQQELGRRWSREQRQVEESGGRVRKPRDGDVVDRTSRLGHLRPLLEIYVRRASLNSSQIQLPPAPPDPPRLEVEGMLVALGPLSSSLWILWELILTESALLVIASTSTRVSSIVLHLIQLIAPLCYKSDYRPYVNAYDPDLRHYRDQLQHRQQRYGLLFGSSDPLLLQLMSNCPNIMVVESLKSMCPATSHSISSNQPAFSLVPTSSSALSSIVFRLESSRDSSDGSPNQSKRVISWLRTSSETSSGTVPKDPVLSSQIDELVLPPKATTDLGMFIESLSSSTASRAGIIFPPNLSTSFSSTSSAASVLEKSVFEYFHDLTLKFLRPFDTYIQPDLKPLMLNPIQETPTPPPFATSSFIDSLFSSDNIEFPFSRVPRTNRFLSTQTFRAWFPVAAERHARQTQLTHLAYCAAVSSYHIYELTSQISRDEIAATILISKLNITEAAEGCAHLSHSALRLRHLLRECRHVAPVDHKIQVEKLIAQLKSAITVVLPSELSSRSTRQVRRDAVPATVCNQRKSRCSIRRSRQSSNNITQNLNKTVQVDGGVYERDSPTTTNHNPDDEFLSACED